MPIDSGQANRGAKANTRLRRWAQLIAAGLDKVPLIVGGIIPEDDAERLRAMGVAAVYTPKDFELNRIMFDIVALAEPGAVAAE
jgi:(2R)-ethylmalonyl-CoA mutase